MDQTGTIKKRSQFLRLNFNKTIPYCMGIYESENSSISIIRSYANAIIQM